MKPDWPFGLDLPDGEGNARVEPPRPVNWNLLRATEAATKWIELDQWLHWLRRTYGLSASILPPFWYRHPELVWELSALHLHWLATYEPTQSASAPLGWHREFALAQQRLREWVAASATRLDRDRPTRQTVWPGESASDPLRETAIVDRADDFRQFVRGDVDRRQLAEDDLVSGQDGPTSEQ